jgi:hypothetical protein
MSRTATTWQLMKDSWHVLMRDKQLVLFPVISGAACFLVMLTFVVPFLGANLIGLGHIVRGQSSAAVYVVLFCYYVCNFFVVFFFNAALVDFVVTRLRGGEPTLGGSMRAAAACLPQIAAWALVASTVGIVLKTLSNRSGFLGQIVIAIVGVAWALVTYFVVPMIVIERKGAMDSIGASKDLLAKTWGKQLVSGLGYGLIGFLLTVPAVIVIIAAIVGAITQGHIGSFAALAVAAVLYIVALGIVISTLRAIFGAVLYLFATTGQAPEGFSANDLNAAIQPARS